MQTAGHLRVRVRKEIIDIHFKCHLALPCHVPFLEKQHLSKPMLPIWQYRQVFEKNKKVDTNPIRDMGYMIPQYIFFCVCVLLNNKQYRKSTFITLKAEALLALVDLNREGRTGKRRINPLF